LLNLTDESFGGVFLGLFFQILLFCILTVLVLRGLTTRNGWFASFRMLILALIGIGILLGWQLSMAAEAGIELEESTGMDNSNIMAIFIPFSIYFIGILAMLVVFFRNRRDIKRWFPAKR
jgi:hypothetical protein